MGWAFGSDGNDRNVSHAEAFGITVIWRTKEIRG
jgi:hypothetical protein